MELSGEVLAGQFFIGVPGIQFASHTALRRLVEGVPEDRVWWVNAADPISPCGLSLDRLGVLPRRVPTSHLVFQGSRLVVVSERRGRAMQVRVGPDHPKLGEYLGFIKVLLTRSVRPARAIVIETINGDDAAAGPYRTALAALFHTTRDGTSVRLMRRY
jgi:ATP-dependent Lhr-like helicase